MNEKRASAKAIAVGSLVAFFGSCIVSCIFFLITFFMAAGSQIGDWEALEDPEYVEMLVENIEMPVFLIIVMLAVIWGGFALLGGYIAGRMGKEHPTLNALWVGGILAGLSFLSVLFNLVGGLGSAATLQGIVGTLGGIAMTGMVFLMAWLGGYLARGNGGEET